MENSKLVTLLKTFSKDEIKEFRRFIDSPFFNKEGKYILRFYDEVKKYYPYFENKNIGREIIFRKLYPGKSYSDVTMRKLTSTLQKLAEEYLNYIYYSSSGSIKQIINLSMLRTRRVSNLFELKAGEIENMFDSQDIKIDIEYFRNRFRAEIEKINFYLDYHSQVKKFQQSLQNIQEFIVYDSLINILDIAYNVHIGLSTMYSGKANIVLHYLENLNLEEVSDILKKSTPHSYHVFELFYLRYLSIINFDEAAYYKYKKAAMKSLDQYNRENQFTILVSLQNFCIKKFVSGDKKFTGELHEIHKIMLKKNLLLIEKEGFMSLQSFRNFVLTAVAVKKYAWMENFIKKYEQKIIPDQRESAYAWAKATADYEKGNLEEALSRLQKVKNHHFLTKHDIKILTLKIFFEMKDYETAIAFADSYRHMVENDRTYSDLHRKSHTCFAVFYTKLVKLIANNKKSDLDFLKNEVSKSVTNSKEWLLKKIDGAKNA